MLKIFSFRIYLGTNNWGWRMFGVGYKSIWFFGFSKNAIKRLSMDKCREEFIRWRDMFESDYGHKPTAFHAWQARQSEIDALEGANDMLTVDNVLLQSEIDALKAQVEGLILQAGDMEKLAIEHMLERDAALIQVDELKVQVEELKADAGCIVSCDDGSLVTVREFHKDIQTIANTVIAEAEEKDG